MLPNLIIIGAERCGTSALYNYLRLHPEITMSNTKELAFFVTAGNWDRGEAWYRSHFAGAATPVRGEASPLYTAYPRHGGVPERMHSVVPDAKLIYLVRDPIDRIIASYVFFTAIGVEPRSFTEALAPVDQRSAYVAKSSYYMQLERYLEYYSADRVLVLQAEALLQDRRAVLEQVFRFLSVNPSFDSRKFDRIHNQSTRLRRVEGVPKWMSGRVQPKPTGRLPWRVRARARRFFYAPFLRAVERPVLDGELRDELVAYLRPDTDKLREFTGMDFAGWST